MHVYEVESIELVSYHLKDIAHLRLFLWKENFKKNMTPIIWDDFLDVFFNRFFLRDLREAKAKKFVNLRKGSMSVK